MTVEQIELLQQRLLVNLARDLFSEVEIVRIGLYKDRLEDRHGPVIRPAAPHHLGRALPQPAGPGALHSEIVQLECFSVLCT